MAAGRNALSHIDFSQHNGDLRKESAAKGRSPLLIQSRNEKIVARYYYFNAVLKKKYQETIEELVYEFDLSQRTISMVLKKESDTIISMVKKKQSIDGFKKKWNYYRW